MSRRKQPWQRTRSEWSCRCKHRYESLRIALTRAEELGVAAGKRLWAYRCPHCKKYHLTSKPQKRES